MCDCAKNEGELNFGLAFVKVESNTGQLQSCKLKGEKMIYCNGWRRKKYKLSRLLKSELKQL